MTTLREAQLWMVAAITGAEVDAADADRHLTASDRMTARERLDVYRGGYKARLVECLEDDYPVLAATLGPELFERLCHAYVDRHPSGSPNLNAFGRHMAAFCREVYLSDEDAATFERVRAFASELATLEWALVTVLHAETSPPLDLATLQAMPLEAWEGARFVKSDAAELHRFTYAVNAYFQAHRVEETSPPVPAPSPTAVVVYRKDLTLWRMDLTPPMTAILAPLFEGATLGEALASLEAEATDPDALAAIGQNLMVWLREWVAAGFFARIETQ